MATNTNGRLKFAPGFDVPDDYWIVCDKNAGSKYIAYTSTWRGKEYFQIKEIYTRGDDWAPGKGGITVAVDKKDDLLDGLMRLLSKEGYLEINHPGDPSAQ